MSSDDCLFGDLTLIRSWILEMLERVSKTVRGFLLSKNLREKVVTVCDEFLSLCKYIKQHALQYTKIWVRARSSGVRLAQKINEQLCRWGPHEEYPVRYKKHCILYSVWSGNTVYAWVYFLAMYMWIRRAVGC